METTVPATIFAQRRSSVVVRLCLLLVTQYNGRQSSGPSVSREDGNRTVRLPSLAVAMSAGGMQSTAEQITIVAISGGSLIFDFTVSVYPEFASPEIRATARAAIEDPASFGLDPGIMAVTIGDQVATAPSAMHFAALSWVMQRAACPTECGTALHREVTLIFVNRRVWFLTVRCVRRILVSTD